MLHYDYKIKTDCEKKRLDHFLVEVQNDLTRSYIQKLIEENFVNVNGCPAKAKYKLKIDDIVDLTVPDPKPLEVKAEPIPLNIVYEDSSILVIDKPAGIVVHPAPGHTSGTLVNALLHHCKDLKGIGGVERPGIVHRLDKDTSGLLLVAKSDSALQSLSQQFKERTIKKIYLAITKGKVKPSRGTINVPIGRHKINRKKMSSNISQGREAETKYEVIKQNNKASLVRLFPKTGRTHQIRVHLASLGYPILGDSLYGGNPGKELPSIPRQALHAYQIEFEHPQNNNVLQFQSPLPPDLGSYARKILAQENP